MNHYLVVFDRSTGVVVLHRQYLDPGEAIRARFTAEQQYSGNPSIEVVVLGARSWADVKRTHGRYFKNLGELAIS